MSSNHLKLNLNKMEMLYLPGKTYQVQDLFITVDNSTVSPFQNTKKLVMTLDNSMLFSTTSVEYDPTSHRKCPRS